MKKIGRSPRFKVAALFVLAMLLFQAADRLIQTDNTNPKRKRGSVNESSPALRVGVTVARAEPVRGTVEDVVFRHAKHVSQKDLDDLTKDVRKGQPMDPAANKTAANAIQDYLKNRKGRYWASVTLEEGAELADRRVVFNVSEGPVLRVRSTQFVGGESLASPARLRTQIQTISGLGFGVFTEATLDDNVKKLEDYYRSFGYADVKVVRELIFSKDNSHVDEIFHIKEGVRAKIDRITISPNPTFTDSEIRSLLRQMGPFWNEAKAKQDQKCLEAYPSYRGLKPKVDLDTIEDSPGLINVDDQITQPPEAGKAGMIIYPIVDAKPNAAKTSSLDDQLRELRQKIDQWYDEARSQGLREFLEISPAVHAPAPKVGSGATSAELTNSGSPIDPFKNKPTESSSEKRNPYTDGTNEVGGDGRRPGKAIGLAWGGPLEIQERLDSFKTAPAKIDTELVAEVRITGNQTIDTAEILRYVNTRASMPFNRSQLIEDCNRLCDSKKFKDVHISTRKVGNGMQITFEVQEFPNIIEEVVFRNVKHVSPEELEDMTRDIRKGLPINPASNQAAARDIQSYLINVKDCWWASVILEEGCLTTDRRVVFNITEGAVVRVRSVQFVGAEGLAGADRLNDVVMAGGVFRLTRAGKDLSDDENNPPVRASAENEFAEMARKLGVNPDLLVPRFLRTHVEDQGNLSDEQKLENHCKAIGYRHARVVRETVVSEDCSQVDLVFHVSGGPRSKVEEITFSDNPVFTRAELAKVIQQKPGEWYSEEQAKQDGKALIFYIGRRGLSPKIEVHIGESDVGGVIVAYEIKELEAPRIGKVFVAGQEPTMEQMRAGPPWLQKLLDAEATHGYPFPAWPSWSEFEDFFLEPIIGRFWDFEYLQQVYAETHPKAERAVEADKMENVVDPLTVLRQSRDMVQRAAALASLKEPMQNDGTQEEQDRCLTILVQAATGRPTRSWFERQNANLSPEDADLLEPLIRLGAIRALAGYNDPRAAKALETVYLMQLPFSRQINSRVRCHALAALEKTGGPTARAMFLRACAERRSSSLAQLDPQIAHDETFAALRGLARFNDREVLDTLVDILEKEGNFALRQRAHMTLKTISGWDLSPDPAGWRIYLAFQDVKILGGTP